MCLMEGHTIKTNKIDHTGGVGKTKKSSREDMITVNNYANMTTILKRFTQQHNSSRIQQIAITSLNYSD